MIAPARVAALDILTAVSAGTADLPTAIASSRTVLHDDRDRALAAEIAAGVQRWRAALDYLIVAFSRRKLDRMDPEVVEILRLSLYQLVHLTRVPASAVVDDAVNLTGRAGKASAAGFVNAVLRSVSRQRRSLPLPPRPDPGDRAAVLDYLSITLSHPRWLIARWLDRFGFDATEAWLEFNNRPAPPTLRANRFHKTPAELEAWLAEEGIAVHRGSYAPEALIVDSGHPLAGRGLDSGYFLVQDEASQLVALLAGHHPGPRALDVCAAPGGKATAIAAAMGDASMLVACDVRRRRVELLKRTVAASGATRTRIVQADALEPLPFSAAFDCVLLDAPCSGLGTLRRDPDIRWKRKESDLAALAEAQRRMLRHAADTVAPGGRLVYATCSSEPEENEAVVDNFLRSTSRFTPVDLRSDDGFLPPALVDARGHLRTCPHLHGLEAFFGAVFVREKL
jgi:16S rRNA (cytosine967-C5)-methyltransferase